MCKGFTSARFSTISLPSCKLAIVLLAAELWFVCLAQAQIQTRRFEDKFLNRSKIASATNVKIDTTAGVISLVAVVDSLSTTANFRLALSGIDSTFLLPKGFSISEVAAIDSVPSLDGVYLVADSRNRVVFFYNASDGSSATPNLAPSYLGSPVDAFSYLEGLDRKVIITDAIGRVIKVNAATGGTVEWPPNPMALPYLSPSAAVALPDRPEVLICETGKNRLISVDIATNNIVWQFDGGADKFNSPVDVEFVRGDPTVYLVTDRGNHRVVLVQRVGASGQILFQFGKTGQAGSDSTSLNSPTDADALPNDNILICDAGNNRLIEVTRQGKIVYTFAHPLYGLNAAYRVPAGIHRDKTLVASKSVPADTARVLPRRLAYESNTKKPYISPPLNFGREVDFDFLRWSGEAPAGTKIRLQLRVVNDLSDTTTALWYGPTSTADYYDNPVTAINPIHDGNRIVQFRAFLETNSKLLTPILKSVTTTAHYFQSTPAGTVLSKTIKDSSNIVITAWRSLEFTTNLPTTPGTSIRIDILDGVTGDSLVAFPAAQQPFNKFDIDPTRVPSLKNKQSISLKAILKTENPSITPKFLGWAVEWNFVRLGPSKITFANSSFAPVTEYRLKGEAKDSVYINLVDPNVLPLLDSVSVSISSAVTHDAEAVFLKLNPTTRDAYKARLPLVFSVVPASNNRKVEVVDRDTLTVRYVDSFDPSDKSSALALIVHRVQGEMRIEDLAGAKIDSISIGDSLYVHVLGKTDRNESPTKRDSIKVRVFNPQTQDSERLTLFELPDSDGVFNTGNFRNSRGLRVVREGTVTNNGRVSANGSDIVTVFYPEPDIPDEPQLTQSVGVRVTPFIVNILSTDEAFDFIVAPNPFRGNLHTQLNLRAQVRKGELTLDKIEIYNLAGDKVRTIPGPQIGLGTIAAGQAVDAKDWWKNLLGDDGEPVASGTYFAKLYVRLFDPAQGQGQQVAALRKMVIIQ